MDAETRKLLAWFIWDKLDRGLPNDPGDIDGWLKEFQREQPIELRRRLLRDYTEFPGGW